MIETKKAQISISGKNVELHQVLGKAEQNILEQMKNLALDEHPKFRLPAPNPVSIERADIKKLKTKKYVIAEKTDGVRFVMFCTVLDDLKICSIVDRAGSVFLLPLRRIPRVLFQGSIVDGELTVDKQGVSTFVIFDAVVVSGITISHLNLADRLVYTSRAFKEFRADPKDPAAIVFKKWILLDAIDAKERLAKAEKKFMCDGVVLMPVDSAVVYGRHFEMYKLKPSGTHTVDFIVMDARGTIGVYDYDNKQNVAICYIDMTEKLFLIGTIVECSYEHGTWKALHARIDKNQANDLLTYQKTLRNIAENISVDELFL
ncbi:mRNA-capping enzyme (mRNA guanylyltransferase) [Paramecium bursaria Chlorella virus NE-JV-1]|nr:mRNA-capping enzyme (mRNA guanylyltransferase) [Paramecium bursaria Chlorella virus NE-JV-1]